MRGSQLLISTQHICAAVLHIPVLVEAFDAIVLDPAACKMDCEIALLVAHLVAALGVRVEFALGIHADVLAHELVLENHVQNGVLLGVAVLAARQHGVGHGLEEKPGEGGAAEENGARVDGVVVLRQQDIDVLDAVVAGRVQVLVHGVLQAACQERLVPENAFVDCGGTQNFRYERVVVVH